MKRYIYVFGIVVSAIVLGIAAPTGEFFTKVANGGLVANETGFNLSLNGFGVKYKFVSPYGIDVYEYGVCKLYSPGYVEFNNIKASILTMGLGTQIGIGSFNQEERTNTASQEITNNRESWIGADVKLSPKLSVALGEMKVGMDDSYVRVLGYSRLTQNHKRWTKDIFDTVGKISFEGFGLETSIKTGYFKDVNFFEVTNDSTTPKKRINENLSVEGEGKYKLKISDALALKSRVKVSWWTTYQWEGLLISQAVIKATMGNGMSLGGETSLEYKVAGDNMVFFVGAGVWYEEGNSGSATYEKKDYVTNTISRQLALRSEENGLVKFGGEAAMGSWKLGFKGKLGSAWIFEKYDRDIQKDETRVSTFVMAEKMFSPSISDVYLKYEREKFSAKFNVASMGIESGAWFASVEVSWKY